MLHESLSISYTYSLNVVNVFQLIELGLLHSDERKAIFVKKVIEKDSLAKKNEQNYKWKAKREKKERTIWRKKMRYPRERWLEQLTHWRGLSSFGVLRLTEHVQTGRHLSFMCFVTEARPTLRESEKIPQMTLRATTCVRKKEKTLIIYQIPILHSWNFVQKCQNNIL